MNAAVGTVDPGFYSGFGHIGLGWPMPLLNTNKRYCATTKAAKSPWRGHGGPALAEMSKPKSEQQFYCAQTPLGVTCV
jgi:hypothetical protein